MSKEVKIGILSLVVLIVLVWGFQFLKGKNLFANIQQFHIKYDNVEQLEVASQVLVNGYKVGAVTKMRMDPDDYSKILVDIDVKGSIRVPKNTQATIISLGLVGGKAIVLDIDRDCKGSDCAQSGDYLPGGMRGMLSSMVPETELDRYIKKIKSGFKGTLDSEGGNDMVEQSKAIVKNLAAITDKLDKMLSKTDKNIEASVANVAALTKSLKESDVKIASILDNLDKLTLSLKNANVDSLIIKGDDAVAEITKSLKGLKSILNKADSSIKSFDGIMNKVNKGDGTLGKLLKDEKLYDDLNLTVKHTNLLLQDMRLYPGRYFNLSLFKKGAKEYQKVEKDPGLE